MKIRKYLLNEKVTYRNGVKVATKAQKKKFKADPQVEIDFYEKQLAQIKRVKYGPGEGSGKAARNTGVRICKSKIKEAKERLKKLNEVKTKVGDQETLVIGYDEAKKLGVQQQVRQIYVMTTPLPMEERMENIKDWQKHGDKLVLSTKISEVKYRKMVEKILIKKWGKP